MIDLDDFKAVNDCTAIRPATPRSRPSRRRSAHMCGSDFCARYGGDEFVAVLAGCDRREAEHRARAADCRRSPASGQERLTVALASASASACFPRRDDHRHADRRRGPPDVQRQNRPALADTLPARCRRTHQGARHGGACVDGHDDVFELHRRSRYQCRNCPSARRIALTSEQAHRDEIPMWRRTLGSGSQLPEAGGQYSSGEKVGERHRDRVTLSSCRRSGRCERKRYEDDCRHDRWNFWAKEQRSERLDEGLEDHGDRPEEQREHPVGRLDHDEKDGRNDRNQRRADDRQRDAACPHPVSSRQQRVHRVTRLVEIRAGSLPEQLNCADSLSLQRELPDVVVYVHANVRNQPFARRPRWQR